MDIYVDDALAFGLYANVDAIMGKDWPVNTYKRTGELLFFWMKSSIMFTFLN